MKILNPRVDFLKNPLGIDNPKPHFSWEFENQNNVLINKFQKSYQLLVFEEKENEQILRWDSGKIRSSRSNFIEYDGLPLESGKIYKWNLKIWDEDGNEIALNDTPFFQMGALSNDFWEAKWIGVSHEDEEAKLDKIVKIKDPTKKELVDVIKTPPVPIFRKDFDISESIKKNGKIKNATIFASALGEYELWINGKRVGDRYFTPEWTDYKKRVLYQTYNVTNLLTENIDTTNTNASSNAISAATGPATNIPTNPTTNTIAAMVADGWYMGLLGPGDRVRQLYYGKNRQLFLELHIEYENGSVEKILTDESWFYHPDGPIRWADHFLGEIYDENFELGNWASPFYNMDEFKGWKKVRVYKKQNERTTKNKGELDVNLCAQFHEPVQIFKELNPIEIKELKSGVFVCNFGQNIAGWVELRIPLSQIESNQIITIKHGEWLDEDGSVYTDNLRLARAIDKYILKDSDKSSAGYKILHPHFTFHGFQYIEISGLKSMLTPDMVIGKALSSNPDVVGAFSCSNEMLNKLWSNILWTQRDNMLSIPTDCPQRNERMGWMGDAQVFAQTATYNMDTISFFRKYIQDIRDDQGKNGEYPDFVPHPMEHEKQSTFGPGWADAGVIIPWVLYLSYGDKKVIEDHFESMKKYIDLIEKRNPDGLWKNWGSNYGDWLNGDTFRVKGYPKRGASLRKDIFATAFYAYSSMLLSKMAKAIGKFEDAEHYMKLSNFVKEQFVKKYVSRSGKIKGNTQAGYAIALGFDLVPEKMRPLLIQNLLKVIKKYKGRLSTGFISTIQMLMALSNSGNAEKAYELVESKSFPSWGYTIEQGATTIWERWDGYVKGRGFQSIGMNSFNHYSIGAVGEWLYRVVLGINFDPENPGMKNIIISPQPGGSLKWAKGEYHSLHGLIRVEWNISNNPKHNKEDKKLTFIVDIPPNTSGTFILPNSIIGSYKKLIVNNKETKISNNNIPLTNGHFEIIITY